MLVGTHAVVAVLRCALSVTGAEAAAGAPAEGQAAAVREGGGRPPWLQGQVHRRGGGAGQPAVWCPHAAPHWVGPPCPSNPARVPEVDTYSWPAHGQPDWPHLWGLGCDTALWRRYTYERAAQPYLGNVVGEWFRRTFHNMGTTVRAPPAHSTIGSIFDHACAGQQHQKAPPPWGFAFAMCGMQSGHRDAMSSRGRGMWYSQLLYQCSQL